MKDKQAIVDWFGNEVVLEKPTLDDIIVYTAKGEVFMRQLVYKDLFFFGDMASVFYYTLYILFI